jgi:hypothetical protein
MKNLLIHSCTYAAPAGTDRDGNETYRTPATLEHVRIVPVLATAKSDVGETKDDKLTLFYAPGISTPAIVPEELARVTWKGADYTVRSVQPCYTQGGEIIHHYEAALI